MNDENKIQINEKVVLERTEADYWVLREGIAFVGGEWDDWVELSKTIFRENQKRARDMKNKEQD